MGVLILSALFVGGFVGFCAGAAWYAGKQATALVVQLSRFDGHLPVSPPLLAAVPPLPPRHLNVVRAPYDWTREGA